MSKPDPRDDVHNCPEHCHAADEAANNAAKQAVREVFYLLGVDVDSPQQVEDFRKSLRFSDELRKLSDKGKIVLVGVLATAMAGAIWIGIKSKVVG